MIKAYHIHFVCFYIHAGEHKVETFFFLLSIKVARAHEVGQCPVYMAHTAMQCKIQRLFKDLLRIFQRSVFKYCNNKNKFYPKN